MGIWRFLTGAALVSLIPAAAAEFTVQVELADSRLPSVQKRKDYSGVVVWLEPASGRPHLPRRTYIMTQKGKRFIPHVLPITVGSTVNFPNEDIVFHHVFSNSAEQPFDTDLYPPGESRKMEFRRDGVVRVFCKIHSSMSAVIVVLQTPYFAVSAPDGAIRIKRVPPGQYTLRVWHERASEDTLTGLARAVSIGEAGLKLDAIRISESGYLDVPHTLRPGSEHPAESTHAVLPGGHK